MRVMLAAGPDVGDPLLQALLLDDALALKTQIADNPTVLTRRLSVLTAFTCCRNVTALHICAEFNPIQCGKLLIEAGADVNARSVVDADGLGGQTPVFHAVNSIFNYSRPMMEMLVSAGASLEVTVPMLLWGETMAWETIVFDTNPVAFAQCGLFRQFQRDERDIYDNIAFLVVREAVQCRQRGTCRISILPGESGAIFAFAAAYCSARCQDVSASRQSTVSEAWVRNLRNRIKT